MFDFGVFNIDDDYSLIGMKGQLKVKNWHVISKEHLRYHREHFSAGK